VIVAIEWSDRSVTSAFDSCFCVPSNLLLPL